MTPQLRDFVSTYKPPKHPEPFFGFFKEEAPKRRTDGTFYWNKIKRNKTIRPILIQKRKYIKI